MQYSYENRNFNCCSCLKRRGSFGLKQALAMSIENSKTLSQVSGWNLKLASWTALMVSTTCIETLVVLKRETTQAL